MTAFLLAKQSSSESCIVKLEVLRRKEFLGSVRLVRRRRLFPLGQFDRIDDDIHRFFDGQIFMAIEILFDGFHDYFRV